MVQTHSKHHLPELESVNRITNLPIVETGWKYAGSFYNRIKTSSNLMQWTLVQAETSLYTVIDTASPAVFLFQGPLNIIDKFLCKGLDIVEQTVPSIHLPPQMIYSNTKAYVTDMGGKIVRPVLKRADSVKQIGTDILASKYTAFAADKLDGALDFADVYVDKYLPGDISENIDEGGNFDDAKYAGSAVKALQTTKHVARFSKKITRRLTRRTLLEAKALKDQSVEAIHVLIYVVELIATDPKLAFQKGKELWASLSKDEPENQARPENLEQLIVLLTRESTRRMVHLINFSASGLKKAPVKMSQVMQTISVHCFSILDTIFKTIHLDGVQQFIWTQMREHTHSFTLVIKHYNIGPGFLLERIASVMIAMEKSEKSEKVDDAKPKPAIENATPKVQVPASSASVAVANNDSKMLSENSANAASKKANNVSPSTDSLKPPPAANKSQLKATHHNANKLISNGESVVQSS